MNLSGIGKILLAICCSGLFFGTYLYAKTDNPREKEIAMVFAFQEAKVKLNKKVLPQEKGKIDIHGKQSVSGVYYHVDGNKRRSFYPGNEGDHLYDGSIDFKIHLLQDEEFFGNLRYRSTDDKLVDKQDFSIERMYFGYKEEARKFLGGDFSANFSEYSLGNSLKGAKAVFGDDKSSRLVLLGGIDTSKWEDLWENRQNDSAGRRFIWGSRLENNLFERKLELNFNYGAGRDDPSYVVSPSAPIFVNVVSIDAKYKINQQFSVSGEIADSITDKDVTDTEVDTKNDKALKLILDLGLKNYTLSSLYSRIGNHFNTTGGFSAQDIETTNLDGMWYLPLKIKFGHYLHMDHNNLSKTKAATTKQLNPGAKFNFKLPRDFNLDLKFDLRKRFSTNKSTNNKTHTYNTALSRDLGIFYTSFGYTRTEIADRINASRERNSDAYSFSLDGDFELKKVKFTWNLSEDVVHDYYRQAKKADFLQNTGFGLKIHFLSSLKFQIKTILADNDYYLNLTDGNNAKYYFSAARSLGKDLDFEVSYEHKGYRYFGGDNNYADNLVRSKVDYKF